MCNPCDSWQKKVIEQRADPNTGDTMIHFHSRKLEVVQICKRFALSFVKYKILSLIMQHLALHIMRACILWTRLHSLTFITPISSSFDFIIESLMPWKSLSQTKSTMLTFPKALLNRVKHTHTQFNHRHSMGLFVCLERELFNELKHNLILRTLFIF